MTDDVAFIVGLMRDNYEAVGFLPETAIIERYASMQAIIQTDMRGNRVGYLLHGKPTPGGLLTVAQHVIEFDVRQLGHGHDAVATLIDRANQANCRAIVLRCAEELPSNLFWQSCGFIKTSVQYPHNKRKRAINVYTLDLWQTLWDKLP